ncbi:MAG: hypothetical protein GY716_08405 [bacterium]|nr:hypothetical protein [bacterium]
MAQRAVTLKIVYYGCALGGKTTNLVTLHRMADPQGRERLMSLATKNDRTLFFDLLPLELGKIEGLRVRIKVYTVPGQVHYEVTRRKVLAGTDGVVLVMDSGADKHRSNAWALENLRHNLKLNGLDPDVLPIVLQWNKRDLPDAVPVSEMESMLNQKGLVSHESIATTGAGVVETFAIAVKAAIASAYTTAGKKAPDPEALERSVDLALAPARSNAPACPREETTAFEHRFDSEAYHEDWAGKGRDRRIIDQETLLSEAVQTGMELAERLDDLGGAKALGDRRSGMIVALSGLMAVLSDADHAPVPSDLMSRLLEATERSRGSLLLFKSGQDVMEERQVVPAGADPLNQAVAPSIGSAAYRLCLGNKSRYVEDVQSEVFFGVCPPGADDLSSCFVAPVVCEGAAFGALVTYGAVHERAIDTAERDFWTVAALMFGLSLHWRGLKQKLQRLEPAATR